MERLNRALVGAVAAALVFSMSPSFAAPPPNGNTHSATGAEGEFGPVTVQGPVTLKVHSMGNSLSLKARATSLTDEFLVVADSPDLQRIAKHFKWNLSWDSENTTLVCQRGSERRLMRLSQNRVERGEVSNGSREAELAVPMQIVDGAVHVPLSALEEFLDVRMTVRGNSLIYFEPLIRSVRFEGTGRRTKMVVDSTAPVLYKSFYLKSPDRFVVDVYGAVIDTSTPTVTHPDLGNVRLGQFELGPAISRVVVPLKPGVSIQAPRSGVGENLSFKVDLPKETVANEPVVNKIGTVQFVKTGQGARLIMNGSEHMRYEWQRLPDNRLVIDIPNALLADPKQEFEGGMEALSAVRLCQNQPMPNPSVRVVLDLTKPLECNIGTGETEEQLLVEVLAKEVDVSESSRGVGSTRQVSASPGGLIVIDPGHGGSDPGAENRALGVNEASVTLDICKRLASLLKQQGWTVVMTRTTDVDVSYSGSSAPEELGARVKVANDKKADLFVSVHCNSAANGKANGTSIHYYKQSDYVLAGELQPHVLAATGRANRGLQANRFYVLTHSQVPAVLVETAFISNSQEGALLADPNYRQKIAEGLASGLRSYAQHKLSGSSAKR